MTPPIHARRSPPTVAPVSRSMPMFDAETRYRPDNHCLCGNWCGVNKEGGAT
jgi:hypothetical protein